MHEIVKLKRPIEYANADAHTQRKLRGVRRKLAPESARAKASNELSCQAHPRQVEAPVAGHQPELFWFGVQNRLGEPKHRNQERNSEQY